MLPMLLRFRELQLTFSLRLLLVSNAGKGISNVKDQMALNPAIVLRYASARKARTACNDLSMQVIKLHLFAVAARPPGGYAQRTMCMFLA